ncbi:hypothetical protein ARMSODRAFT_980541 [Armillaria solidipes]|uniref:Zn(2)-C6 fungal-type domain-containing protein n=1 Tax=Armillaria solidipes TaxID=1076256 RepID=A0A2H3BFU0_9AGAR|nr:hypothetical protein ARMSODRAFT_980541 [Armillaria solidipes]
MSSSNEYRLSVTPEPYESAPTPPDLTAEEYKALTAERAAEEERYDEAVGKHEGWKAMKAKEARAEALRLKEVARAAKLEALKRQELEKEKEKERLQLEAEEKERLRLEAEEKQRKLDLEKREREEDAAKKALEEAAAKKKQDDLERERQDEENENLLAAAGIPPSGEDGDSESDPADPKTAAMAELRKKCKIVEGKKKAGSAETRKCKVRSTSLVESGEEGGNASAGPSVPKRLKTEPEPTAQDKVFTGSGRWRRRIPNSVLTGFLGRCGKCRTDKAVCFVCGGVRTCQRCRVKKARCTFNKSGEDSGAAESPTVLELLQDICARLTRLEDKVDAVAGRVEDLVDDYDVDNEVKYPEDFIPKSVKAEFEASRMELRKTGDIYCEVLREVAKHRLDRDMALIKAEGLTSLSSELPLGVDDPYEILNKSFWIGTVGAAGLCEKMLARNKFLRARRDFYNAHGRRVEWQLWKQLLKDQEGYRVEDSDEPLDLEEQIRTDMIPGAESVGIPDLDVMIKMPMPAEDPEEEAEKERRRQAMAKMRANKREKGEAVESEAEMYEDLEQVLVQEEVGKDVEMAGPSGADAA